MARTAGGADVRCALFPVHSISLAGLATMTVRSGREPDARPSVVRSDATQELKRAKPDASEIKDVERA